MNTRSQTKHRNPSTDQEEKKDPEEEKGGDTSVVASLGVNFQELAIRGEEVETLPIAGGAEGLALFVSQGNLMSGWVSVGSDVMQQVFNQEGSSEVTSLFVVQDCILAITDKKIHILCTCSKAGWFTGASIKAVTPTTLDVPGNESVLGVQWHESIFVIWTEETGKVYSYAYLGNGNFSNANLIPFSNAPRMAAVGIRSNESFYGVDRDLLESDKKGATLHFDPPKPEGTPQIEIPACRIEAVAASGNAYYPIKAHNKKGEAFIYAIRPDANGVEGLITVSFLAGRSGILLHCLGPRSPLSPFSHIVTRTAGFLAQWYSWGNDSQQVFCVCNL